MLTQAHEVDPDIYHKATSKLAAKEAHVVRSVATLSVVDQAIKCRIEGIDDDRMYFLRNMSLILGAYLLALLSP